MVEQLLQDELRISFCNPVGGERSRAVPLPGPSCQPPVLIFDRGEQPASSPWRAPSGYLGGRRRYTPAAAVSLMAAAVRSWRRSARSRRELRKLSDHQLKDIGVRREAVGYRFPKALWYRD